MRFSALIKNYVDKSCDNYAQIKTPKQTNPEELQGYDLVGFGSGIYGGKAHKDMLELADNLPQVTDKKAFIFSTSGGGTVQYMTKTHRLLKEKLQSKGYTIIDDFTCKGFNTFAFLRLFGGMNKGRPNSEDLKLAEEFAIKTERINHKSYRNDYSCAELNFVPNHLLNHLKLPHSSLEAHVKQGNSFPATSITLDILSTVAFSLTISSTCFSISPDISNHLNIELKITTKRKKCLRVL